MFGWTKLVGGNPPNVTIYAKCCRLNVKQVVTFYTHCLIHYDISHHLLENEYKFIFLIIGFASALDIGLSNWGLEFVTISL